MNKECQSLKTQLENGNDIYDILCGKDSSSFCKHLHFFYRIMSLPHAIDSALSLASFEKDIRNRLIKKSIYPLCIFTMAYVMLWFFTSSIIPQMMASFAQDDQFQGLAFLITLIKWCCSIIALFVLIGFILLVFLHLHKDVRTALLTKRKITILQDYESFLFSGYMIQMEKHGISTKDSMLFLGKIEKGSVFQKMVEDMHRQLQEGEDYHVIIASSPYLSKTFQQTFRIGSAANRLQSTLESFMLQQENHWDMKLKKYTIFIQCISYSFVGLVILIVYQIMLIPLQKLNQM